MKTLQKKLLPALFCLAMYSAQGQSALSPMKGLSTEPTYDLAVGVRAGETNGLTVKKFLRENQALEGIIGVWNHGLSFTILYEIYAPAFGVTGLNWFYGGGGHLATKQRYFYRYYDRGRYYYYQYSNVGVGIDGVAGIEYKIPRTPIAMSLEVKPYIEVVSRGGIWSSLDPGFGIKLTF